MRLRSELKREHVKGLYEKLSENLERTSKAIHFDYFDFRGGELYYRGKDKPLTNEKGELKLVGTIAEILDKDRLRNLGFNIPKGEVTVQQIVKLNSLKEKLPSESDIPKWMK